VAAGAVLLVFGVFMVGLMNLFGYTGTTLLRPVKESSSVWQNLKALFSEYGGVKGKPYYWEDGNAPTVSGGVVHFDERLIKSLTYLSRAKEAKCGWNGTHEKIGLLVSAEATSDLSYPPQDLPVPSPLYRGLGLRIAGADRIKCTLQCPDRPPVKFNAPGDEISFHYQNAIKPEEPVPGNCRVICAVDYYPANPLDALPEETTKPASVDELEGLNPGEFDYKEIEEKSRQAAVYKTAQTVYELLSADKPGCDSPEANLGNKRIIPTTIIIPQWIQKELGDTWAKLLEAGRGQFPFNFQDSSPTAGLSYDPYLNLQGVQINY